MTAPVHVKDRPNDVPAVHTTFRRFVRRSGGLSQTFRHFIRRSAILCGVPAVLYGVPAFCGAFRRFVRRFSGSCAVGFQNNNQTRKGDQYEKPIQSSVRHVGASACIR